MEALLKRLLSVRGTTGRESPVARQILEELAGCPVETETDALGNLMVTRRGTGEHPRTVMLSAHMDHIGYIVTGYEDDGTLRVTNLGAVSADMSLTRHVVFENGQEGVVVCEPVEGTREMKHLFADIGAADRAEAESRVALGDTCEWAPDCFSLGEHRLAAPGMDDRSACAVLVKLMQILGPVKDTVIALFSVQEEIGCRGARVASFAKAPDLAIALDVTAWGDTPGTKQPAIRLGAGAAVKVQDRGSISDPGLRDELLACGQAHGIPLQREVLPFGGTDAGAMQTSRGGIPVCTVSIPCRYVHSACEVVDLRDLEGALSLLKNWLEA